MLDQLCFQKLVSGELHTFYFGRFPKAKAAVSMQYILNTNFNCVSVVKSDKNILFEGKI